MSSEEEDKVSELDVQNKGEGKSTKWSNLSTGAKATVVLTTGFTAAMTYGGAMFGGPKAQSYFNGTRLEPLNNINFGCSNISETNNVGQQNAGGMDLVDGAKVAGAVTCLYNAGTIVAGAFGGATGLLAAGLLVGTVVGAVKLYNHVQENGCCRGDGYERVNV